MGIRGEQRRQLPGEGLPQPQGTPGEWPGGPGCTSCLRNHEWLALAGEVRAWGCGSAEGTRAAQWGVWGLTQHVSASARDSQARPSPHPRARHSPGPASHGRRGRQSGSGVGCAWSSWCPHRQCIWGGGRGVGAGFCREGAICSDNWCWAAFTQQPVCLGRQHWENIALRLGPAGGAGVLQGNLQARPGCGGKSFRRSDLDPSCCGFSRRRRLFPASPFLAAALLHFGLRTRASRILCSSVHRAPITRSRFPGPGWSGPPLPPA